MNSEKNRIQRHHSQYFACGILSLGGLIGGTVTGWSSTALPSIESSKHFNHLVPSDLSWIASIVNLGTLASSIVAGYTIKKYGRRSTLFFSAIPYIFGWIALAVPMQVWMLFAGRFLTGFALGLMAIAGSVYLVEIAEPDLRGKLSTIWFVAIKVGILFAYVVGAVLPYNQMSAILVALSVGFGASIAFLPESPRWLVTKWRIQNAVDSLCWLRACDKFSPSPDILWEINEMQEAVIKAEKESNDLTIKNYLANKTVLRSIIVASILMIFKEAGGGNVFSYYAVQIFEKTGSALDPHLSGVIAGVSQLIALLFTTCYVDKVGRRVLLIVTFLVMSMSLVILGLFYEFNCEIESVDTLTQFSGWIPLISFVAYHAANSGGPFVLTWTVMSEVIPSNVIGFVSGVATGLGWIAAFVLARYYEDMNTLFGVASTFWIYAVLSALGAMCIHLLVPETACKSLENIHKMNEIASKQNELGAQIVRRLSLK